MQPKIRSCSSKQESQEWKGILANIESQQRVAEHFPCFLQRLALFYENLANELLAVDQPFAGIE